MLRLNFATLAAVAMVMFAATPGAKAGELEQASATVGAIEQDMGAARIQAGYFHEQVRYAQGALEWHARMEQERGAQMAYAGCARPPSREAWFHCDSLFRDMREHARLKIYWNSIVEAKWAAHITTVQRAEQLAQASYWWKNRLAMLQRQQIVVASEQ